MERSELEFALAEEEDLLRRTVRDFAATEIAPRHERIDHEAVHPEESVEGMKALGLFGVFAPAAAGGAGMSFLAHVLAIEELAAAAGGVGGIVAAHGVGVDALVGAGGRDASLVEATSGAALLAPALGEDEPEIATRAVGEGAATRLTGVKRLVPFPGRVSAYVVLARDERGAASLHRVAADAPGVRHGGRDVTLGLAGLETATLRLEDAPAERLGGPDLVARTLDGARVAVAALLVGLGRGAIAHAVRYAQERRQFDKALFDFHAMKERLARSDWRVEAARAATHGAARLRDRGEPCRLAAARARAAAAEAAIGAADDALQVYGGYGYSREYHAERFYRDARFPGFGEGRAAELVSDVARALAE